MTETSPSSMDEIVGNLNQKIASYGADERVHQLSGVKLKPHVAEIITRMRRELDQQIAAKQGVDIQQLTGGKRATKNDAVELLLELAGQVMELRQAQAGETEQAREATVNAQSNAEEDQEDQL